MGVSLDLGLAVTSFFVVRARIRSTAINTQQCAESRVVVRASIVAPSNCQLEVEGQAIIRFLIVRATNLAPPLLSSSFSCRSNKRL